MRSLRIVAAALTALGLTGAGAPAQAQAPGPGVKRRLIALATVVGMTLLGLVALTAPAQAKVPGPNGEILFLRFDPAVGDTVLYTANPNGSHEQPLLPGTPVECAKWSPDGSRIATCGNPEGGATQIINPDTGSYRDIPMPDPALATFCWIWSPDAERLACESFGQTDPSLNGIYTIRTSDGRGLKRVTSNPGADDLPFDYSPNGEQIVFSRVDPSRPSNANVALFVVNTDGSGLRRITPWGYPDQDDGGSWSPNGQAILFDCNPADFVTGSLCLVHPDSSGLTSIPLKVPSFARAHDPGWSPDGTKIVFNLFTATSSGTATEGIYTANADGSNVQQATTTPTFDGFPDWAPHQLAG
jgi:Tol biopolymer transport system component